MQLSEINVNNIIRSAVILIVGIPVSMGITNSLATSTKLAEESAAKSAVKTEIQELKVSLEKPCLQFAVSKADSKLEREAKNDLDELVGGELNHRELCNWVL